MNETSLVAIGDIHGCPHTLQALISDLKEYNDRTFVFVGDYIDRGPDSKGVVDYLLEFREDVDCVFLRGNHEQMMLDALQYGQMSNWLMNGGQTTLESYGINPGKGLDAIPDDHMEFYKNTRLFYDTPEYFFVHAGLSPGITIKESIRDREHHQDFLWERSHLSATDNVWEKTVVFGHTPRYSPIHRNRMIGIDTGCVYESRGYGTLTSVLLPEENFIQQNCID